ncbi:MAG: plasmid pRiA4b ORF-3 family protein [Dysgonamonadaceae bacterium]|jgi:hypothetical protein|nr:plasmid pRiA4b ORF-3 family protein [Dysgonamonadaceae bacterium]
MVYRFVILSDEVDNFRRDITIDSDATFFDLHNAILESVAYTKDQMTSFFICDEDWAKETEITLIEMGSNPEEDSYVMDNVRLSEFLEDEGQALIYVFDYLADRSFFVKLREIIPGKTQEKAEVVRSEGKAPNQVSSMEDLNNYASQDTALVMDEDFFEDTVNLDEYDEEDFGNLMEGNPFDNY